MIECNSSRMQVHVIRFLSSVDPLVGFQDSDQLNLLSQCEHV